MPHRGTIYNLRVHTKGKPDQLVHLGNLDGTGTYLGDFLHSTFGGGFEATNDSDDRTVSCTDSDLQGDELRLFFRHGESGVVAEIHDGQGNHQYDQASTDTQFIRCGSVMRLPRNRTAGWWAVHVNNNRRIKGLVHSKLLERFRAQFSDLMLVIEPCVIGSVLEQALADGRLESVKLTKYDRSSDIADANRWVRGDTRAKIELRLSPIGRGKRLFAERAHRALTDNATFGQITVFEGIPFDEAKVEVELENGTTRTFNIQYPEGGHPFAEDIHPAMQDGEPTKAGVWSELGRVLTDMQ